MTTPGKLRPEPERLTPGEPPEFIEPFKSVQQDNEPFPNQISPVSQRRLFYDLLWVPDVLVIVLVGIFSDFIYHVVFYGAFSHWKHGLLIGGISAVIYSASSVFKRRYSAAAVLSEKRLTQMVDGILHPWIVAFGGVLLSIFLIKLFDDISRGAFLLASVLSLAGLFAVRFAVVRLVRQLSKSGSFLNLRSLVIADDTTMADLRLVRAAMDVSVVETVHLPDWDTGNLSDPHRIAVLNEIYDVVASGKVDQIVLALPLEKADMINYLVDELTRFAVPIRIYCSSPGRELLSNPIELVNKVPTIDIRPHRQDGLEGVVKTWLDMILAVVILIVLSPVMIAAAIAVKLDSRGPVLFKQRRHGFAQNVFRIYKFRTMVTMDDGPDVKQATRHDPRVTRVGSFLRRTSLDELPQLFNVLKGEMSIVGPRPHAVAHNLHHERKVRRYAARHNVKPGITGWAQINGCRGEIDTPELLQARVEYDLWYIKHWSVWLDIKILIKTVFVVISGKDAY